MVSLSFSGGNVTVGKINIIPVFPENNSIIPMFQPTVVFTISHVDGVLLNYSVYGGRDSFTTTLLLGSDSGVGNGTYMVNNFYSANDTGMFWWRVYVNGSGDFLNKSFAFNCSRGPGQIIDTPGFVSSGFFVALSLIVFGLFVYTKKFKVNRK